MVRWSAREEAIHYIERRALELVGILAG